MPVRGSIFDQPGVADVHHDVSILEQEGSKQEKANTVAEVFGKVNTGV